MIELSHSPDDCIEALKEIEPAAEDFLGDVYWGCMTGRHDGWTVVEADDEEDARAMVPEPVRSQIQVTRVKTVAPELAHAIDPEAKNPGRV
jgi:hypothetical protein